VLLYLIENVFYQNRSDSNYARRGGVSDGKLECGVSSVNLNRTFSIYSWANGAALGLSKSK